MSRPKRKLPAGLRWLITLAVLAAGWQLLVWSTGVARFILPGPWPVLKTLITESGRIGGHALVTLTEILLGLLAGTLLGAACALAMACSRPLRGALMPLVVVSQAVPVFALAPLLVVWFGYGLASKVAMATLIIFFPVTSAFFDGLRHTPHEWLDLARTMGAGPWQTLWQIRLPAALPSLASGLRVAAAVAPIGAVIGEWVGASAGLGHLMLVANARVQPELMFATLTILALLAVTLYVTVDRCLRRLIRWLPDPDAEDRGESGGVDRPRR
jgi:putative hydroxymethylpyrimidine transport system permease protein